MPDSVPRVTGRSDTRARDVVYVASRYHYRSRRCRGE